MYIPSQHQHETSVSLWRVSLCLNNTSLFLWHITTDCDSIEMVSFVAFGKLCRISSFFFLFFSTFFYFFYLFSCSAKFLLPEPYGFLLPAPFLFRPILPVSTGLHVKPCNGTRDLSIFYKHSLPVVMYPWVYFMKPQHIQHFSYVCTLSLGRFSAGLGTQFVLCLRYPVFIAVSFGHISCLLKSWKHLNCRSPWKLRSFS